jgi:hypothetical protein
MIAQPPKIRKPGKQIGPEVQFLDDGDAGDQDEQAADVGNLLMPCAVLRLQA